MNTIKNHVLPIKEIVLVFHVTLVKPNVMQKLDGINVIIQLKVQSHRKFFKATSTAALHVLQNFKCSKKCRDQEEL